MTAAAPLRSRSPRCGAASRPSPPFRPDRLMRTGQTGESAAWLARLERVAPSDLTTVRLRGLYHGKRSEFRDAAAHLKRAARPSEPAKPETDAGRVRAVARMADEL